MLEGYKPREGHKRRAPAALCLDEELEESCPSGSCQDLWPVQGVAAGMEQEVFTPTPAQDTQVSAHRKPVLARVTQLIPNIYRYLDMQLLPHFPAVLENAWDASSLSPPPSSQALAGLHLWLQGWIFPPSPCIV